MASDSSFERRADVGVLRALFRQPAGRHVDVIVLDDDGFVRLDGIAMNKGFELGGHCAGCHKNRVVGHVDHKRPSPLGAKAVKYNADVLAHAFMLPL